MQQWALLVQEYSIKLHYLEGKQNIFADVLSRLPDPSSTTKHLPKQLHDDLNDRNELCNKIDKCNINLLNEYIPEKVPWDEKRLRNAQRKDPSCINIVNQLNNKFTAEKTVPI